MISYLNKENREAHERMEVLVLKKRLRWIFNLLI